MIAPRFAALIRLLCLAVVCAWFGLAGCSPPQEVQWQKFSPPEGKFAILLPGEPVVQPSKSTNALEAKVYRIVSVLSHISALAVGYADQPPELEGRVLDPDRVLDLTRDQTLSNLRGELVSEKKITLKGHPGREIVISVARGYTVVQRIYLADKRMYSLMIIAGSKGIQSPDAKKFFDSFDILR